MNDSEKIVTHVPRVPAALASPSCSICTNSPVVVLAEAELEQTLLAGIPLISLPMMLSVAVKSHVEPGEEGMVVWNEGKLAEILSWSRWMGKAALAGSLYHTRLELDRPG